jgi:NAD+ synthase (glutamine-hydrolysing)
MGTLSPNHHPLKLADHGFFRLSVAAPALSLADPATNSKEIARLYRECCHASSGGLLCPELSLSGYSCADLFYQEALLDACEDELLTLASLTDGKEKPFLIIGLPLRFEGRLYNCAAFLAGGKILGIVPKCHLPNSQEFYEMRWFASGRGLAGKNLLLRDQKIPFGPDLLFQAAEFPWLTLGLEICEDLWVTEPPSGQLALAGATLILNPSASDELVGKADYRRQLVLQQSARCLAAYAYAAASPGESSTDLVYSGHSIAAENGILLWEADRFRFEGTTGVIDFDLARLVSERQRNSSFSHSLPPPGLRRIYFSSACPALLDGPDDCPTLHRKISPTPFVPGNDQERSDRCEEILNIQGTGLARRARHTRSKALVVGLSGGLDSTLAALVMARALDQLGWSRDRATAVVMPGLGSTGRTQDNARAIAQELGFRLREIPIGPAVNQHFKDIGHPPTQADVVFENAQARERTQILMDVANQEGGFVVGTGDLSETALGWCTFNADHISMYHVNVGVPKTLVSYLIGWFAQTEATDPLRKYLLDIIDTPISPELLPLGESSEMVQKTEDSIGPYILHDFFLYHAIRIGSSPKKVLYLARIAFANSHSTADLEKHLDTFYSRFFSQQFKRSTMPDGPKVGTLALSPRGDWRMPSDASSALWRKPPVD